MTRSLFRTCAVLTALGLAAFLLVNLAPIQAQAPANNPTPLDQAITWIQDARRNYTAVRDYTCTLVSRESVKGQLGEENIVLFKFKRDFNVYMRWLSPNKSAGQEVVYSHGKNNNKMRVHSKGLGGKIAGFVSIAIDDPRVLEHSRHTIVEAGIGNMIERTAAHWDVERKIGKSVTKIAEYNFNNKPCYRIESIRTERRPEFYSYRSVIYLEKDSKLPIRNENYDWPRQGGNPEGEILEQFSYIDLRFNTGLTDQEFNK